MGITIIASVRISDDEGHSSNVEFNNIFALRDALRPDIEYGRQKHLKRKQG
jgi:hypothetical protein